MAEPRKSAKKASSAKQAPKKSQESKQEAPADNKKRRIKMPKFLRSAGAYFKNSFQELRHTKWPNRRATASLTLAVIVFTALIMSFIIAVDYVFNALFERLIA